MKIYILAVGKLKESYYKDAERYFLGIIRKKADIEVVEIEEGRSKEMEGERITAKIPSGSRTCLLDVGSKNVRTGDIADFVRKAGEECRSAVFIIGGPLGFGDNVYSTVKKKISLSSMTFPHRLARILLLEQLSRI